MSCRKTIENRVRNTFREVCKDYFGKNPKWPASPKSNYKLKKQSEWEEAEAEIVKRLVAADDCHKVLEKKYGPKTPGTWETKQSLILGDMTITSYKNCC